MIDQATATKTLTDLGERIVQWVADNLLVQDSLLQLAALAVVLPGAWAVGRALLRRFHPEHHLDVEGEDRPILWRLADALPVLAGPALAGVFLALTAAAFDRFEIRDHILQGASSLVLAWMIIRLAASLVRSRTTARIVAILAWSCAALNTLRLLRPLLGFLDSLGFEAAAGTRISLLTLVQGALTLSVALKLAEILTEFTDRHFNRPDKSLSPSARVLIAKTLRIVLYAVAVLTALSAVGINLTAFAVFTGAVGVGIGFGLQKIFSNLVSGVILLMDKSIKPGDIIELDGSWGRISSLNARYVSLNLPNGKELLIPNEELINNRVLNWTHSDTRVNMVVTLGVAYSTDLRLGLELAARAAVAAPGVLPDPAPVCRLKEFADSSVNFDLFYWIDSKESSPALVRHNVLLGVWEAFQAAGIEIPFPQRDIHIRSMPDKADTPLLRDA